jgi:IS4 transposase
MDQTKTQTGKHDWVVFLCTGTALSATEILQRYAMRWAIEVYFKEAKQPLGLLKEQSNHYAAYIIPFLNQKLIINFGKQLKLHR